MINHNWEPHESIFKKNQNVPLLEKNKKLLTVKRSTTSILSSDDFIVK